MSVERILGPYDKHLVEGDLVEGGAQYDTAVDTTTLDVDVVVGTYTVNSPILGPVETSKFILLEVWCSLIAEVRAVSTATADLKWKWQARNSGGTWIDLHTEVTETDINTTYVSQAMQGYMDIQSGLNELPMDLQLLLQCNETNEGRGRVANTAYITITGCRR